MRTFVYRNSTVEIFFGNKDVAYSGYGDISYLGDEIDRYIWVYMLPFKTNRTILAGEVGTYFANLQMVYNQIPKSKQVITFTIVNFYDVKLCSSNSALDSAIVSYNQNLLDFARQNTNVRVIDFGEFLSYYPKQDVVDWKYYFLSKMQLAPKLASGFKKWFTRKIEEIELKRKKCLVLDLDNTLWGGVLGEDGINGIKIGGNYPGSAFQMFQEYLLELSNNGVILTICSKNNEQDVLEVWDKNPYLIIKKENVVAYRVNWNNKADNIKELAEELNIGLDSLIFVDDNPTERELVKQMLPMVEVPDFPEHPYLIPQFIKRLVDSYFRVYDITNEDRAKTEQYRANVQRRQVQASFVDFDDYLRSLDIEMTIQKADQFNIIRIAQMTQKTNQFNLTTHRYAESDIQRIVDDGGKVYCLSVKDKFGDNGITGCIIIRDGEIDTFLLSCRILGKNIETAFIQSMLSKLKDEGVYELRASYVPTAKNALVADFYSKVGFVLQENVDGVKTYTINLLDMTFDANDYYRITII